MTQIADIREIRKFTFSEFLPETKQLIIQLYGTHEAYINAIDQANNPNNVLEEACILYDRSSEYEGCAIQGLKLLGLNEDDIFEDPSITLYRTLEKLIFGETCIKYCKG